MPRTGRPRTFDEEAVLDAARDLFWSGRYATTSLRDLKGELGVLPGSLYAAFGDKHELFVRVLERYAEGARAATAALRGDGPILPRVRTYVAQPLAAARAMPGRGCMLGNTAMELLPGDDAACRIVRGALDAMEQALEDALVRAKEAGEIDAGVDCRAQAKLLVTLMQGLHVVARTLRDPRRLEDAIEAAFAGLVPRTRAPRRRRRSRG